MKNATSQARRKVRYEAARIMVEEGVRDYKKAKQKACSRVGIQGGKAVPSNLEIEDSLSEQLQIFRGESTEHLSQRYLNIARDMMETLSVYSPALTGAALSGNITTARPIELQVFADTFEEVRFALEHHYKRMRVIQKRLRFARSGFANITGLELDSKGVMMEILVFQPQDPYPPLSPATGKPVFRGSLKKVRRLIESFEKIV